MRKGHLPMHTLPLDGFSASAAKFTVSALTKIKTMPNIGSAAADLARSHAPQYGNEPCRPFASRRDPHSRASRAPALVKSARALRIGNTPLNRRA
jgi:hypothetical protein